MAKQKPYRIMLGEPRSFVRNRIFEESPTLDQHRDRSQLGGSLGAYVPPGAQYDYKPPSVFAQYRVLTIIFGSLLAAALIYWALGPLHDQRFVKPQRPAASADQPAGPVYIEPLAPQR